MSSEEYVISMDDTDSSSTERQASLSPSSEDMSSAAPDELALKRYSFKRQTVGGWVAAEIRQIEPTAGEQIAVTVMTDAGRTVTWKLEKPNTWTYENLFVRIAEQHDHGEDAINRLEGDVHKIRPATGAANEILDETGTWELYDPAQPGVLFNIVSLIVTFILAFIIMFILCGVVFFPALKILQVMFSGGTSDQIVYWGTLTVWVLTTIAILLIPYYRYSTSDAT